jgi:hypothetical protein
LGGFENTQQTESVEERRIRIDARILRHRFERSHDAIRSIVAKLSDEGLVQLERKHHAQRLQEINLKQVVSLQVIT